MAAASLAHTHALLEVTVLPANIVELV